MKWLYKKEACMPKMFRSRDGAKTGIGSRYYKYYRKYPAKILRYLAACR